MIAARPEPGTDAEADAAGAAETEHVRSVAEQVNDPDRVRGLIAAWVREHGEPAEDRPDGGRATRTMGTDRLDLVLRGRRILTTAGVVAREVGVAPGTLENLRKGRSKGLRGWIERKIDAALGRALEREAARINHELAMAKARGLAADRRALASMVAARADLNALLAEAPPK